MQMIYIDDDIHCERAGPYATFEGAIAELRRRASIKWDSFPNRAPCTSWRSCGREYHVLEFDASPERWKLLRKVAVLKVSAKGVEWIEGFERIWTQSAGDAESIP